MSMKDSIMRIRPKMSKDEEFQEVGPSNGLALCFVSPVAAGKYRSHLSESAGRNQFRVAWFANIFCVILRTSPPPPSPPFSQGPSYSLWRGPDFSGWSWVGLNPWIVVFANVLHYYLIINSIVN
jgi:hypothetical protein